MITEETLAAIFIISTTSLIIGVGLLGAAIGRITLGSKVPEINSKENYTVVSRDFPKNIKILSEIVKSFQETEFLNLNPNEKNKLQSFIVDWINSKKYLNVFQKFFRLSAQENESPLIINLVGKSFQAENMRDQLSSMIGLGSQSIDCRIIERKLSDIFNFFSKENKPCVLLLHGDFSDTVMSMLRKLSCGQDAIINGRKINMNSDNVVLCHYPDEQSVPEAARNFLTIIMQDTDLKVAYKLLSQSLIKVISEIYGGKSITIEISLDSLKNKIKDEKNAISSAKIDQITLLFKRQAERFIKENKIAAGATITSEYENGEFIFKIKSKPVWQ
jgi:hypothetical protein